MNSMGEVLEKDEFRGLSRTMQAQYAEKAILKMVSANAQQGITMQEIREHTPFAVSTISKYLDVLLAKRRIFKVTRGNVTFYFPNGIPLHQINEQEIEDGKKAFRLSLVQNNLGKMLYIQELELDGIGMKQVVGGITIPVSSAVALSKVIRELVFDKAKLEH